MLSAMIALVSSRNIAPPALQFPGPVWPGPRKEKGQMHPGP
jgi:hypothetical protein